MQKPRVLFVSRTSYQLPLNPSLARKWNALEREFELRVLASAGRGARRHGPFVLVGPPRPGRLSGLSFWLLLPGRVTSQLRRFRPEAVITQSPFEAAAVIVARRLSGSHAPVITDVQGDWRSATRLYGSRHRAVLSPIADALAAWALRRVDAIRTISPYTSRIVRELGVEPTASFPTYVDMSAFTGSPPPALPRRPQALFVGVLEAYKNVDGLAAAWRQVRERLPEARLHIVGKGSLENVVAELVREHSDSVRWTRELTQEGVAGALDEATLLVLPSRSEGMGRVIIEAFCRARPVVGTRVGGIPDLIVDGSNGLLIEPGSIEALAEALVVLLGDRALALELSSSAQASAAAWLQTPEEFASRTRALVEARSKGNRPDRSLN
jgi:glycosyltransferase involved in cell wall biosynthesis